MSFLNFFFTMNVSKSFKDKLSAIKSHVCITPILTVIKMITFTSSTVVFLSFAVPLASIFKPVSRHSVTCSCEYQDGTLQIWETW